MVRFENTTVRSDYFNALGIPLLRGRYLNELDFVEEAPLVVVIDEDLARDCFGDQNPIGQRMTNDWWSSQETMKWPTIVGVVGNVKNASLTAGKDYRVYLTGKTSNMTWQDVIIRLASSDSILTVAGIEEWKTRITSGVREINPNAPVGEVQAFQHILTIACGIVKRRLSFYQVFPFWHSCCR